MMDSYDVIVVGAGPGGLFAAKGAIEGGASVLLIEEHPAIGTPVQCAEGFSQHVLEEFGFTGEEPWVHSGLKGVLVHSPGGKVATLRVPSDMDIPVMSVCERKAFEKLAAVKLAKMGVHVLTRAKATALLFNEGEVTGVKIEHLGKEIEVQCRVVIAADGPISRVAKWAELEPYRNLVKFDTGAQFQMAGIDLEGTDLEIFFGDFAPMGYAWIFPKGRGFANVGLGIEGKNERKALEYLERFVESEPRLRGHSIVEINVGPIPAGGTIQKFTGDGIMVVGDAARMVNPFSGGGINYASKAGRNAGETAALAVKKNDTSNAFLQRYQKWFETEYSKEMKRIYGFKMALHELEPAELDRFIGSIGEIQIPDKFKELDQARRFVLKKVMKVLFKNMGLALKVRKSMKRHGSDLDSCEGLGED